MAEKYGIGTKHMTKEGYELEIVEKLENDKRRIRFKNGYKIEVFIHNIKTGNIKNPYHPSVFGIGYYGVGEYKSYINANHTPEYIVWRSMLARCYDGKCQEKNPTYVGTTVCEEWHNFQNFAKWYKDNYPKIDGIKFHLDKDLLQRDVENKIYSPNICIFLPHNINTFLSNKYSNNTSGYTGVSWHKKDKKWRAEINLFGEDKSRYLGEFHTPEFAYEAYKSARKVEAEKVKYYLRSLNYFPEEVIQLIK